MLATDQSAAPGLLAETGIAAAQLAVQQLSEHTASEIVPGATSPAAGNSSVADRAYL